MRLSQGQQLTVFCLAAPWLEHLTRREWKVLGLGKVFWEAAGKYAVKMELNTYNTSFTINLQLAA